MRDWDSKPKETNGLLRVSVAMSIGMMFGMALVYFFG